MKLKALLLAGFMALASTSMAQTISGAGATFPAPLYIKWAQEYKKETGVEVNYQAIGSGGGQNQILKGTVDFGASDAPMDVKKLRDNNLYQFPTVIGSIVIIVNIPNLPKDFELNLSRQQLSDIYLGKYRFWNEISPTLPKLAIAPIYRADGSGTTHVFTEYLSKISNEWKEKVGFATSVKWPIGAGSRGNDGVTASVRNISGSIGYVEYIFAKNNNMKMVNLENADGYFITPTEMSFHEAAKKAVWDKNNGYVTNLLNLSGDKTWPIVSTTYIIISQNKNNENVNKFFIWGMTTGDKIAEELNYIPIPLDPKDVLNNTK